MHDSKTQYLIPVERACFTEHLRASERAANMPPIVTFDATRNMSVWTVADVVVAESEGLVSGHGAHWVCVELNKFQHSLVVDQLSNNEDADDAELVDYFCSEGGLGLVAAAAVLLERPRCRLDPMYEPLTHARGSKKQ